MTTIKTCLTKQDGPPFSLFLLATPSVIYKWIISVYSIM